MYPVPLPRGPWDKLAADLKGPFKGKKWKYLLVIIDYYSKWPEVMGINSISSVSMVKAFKNVFTRFGLPPSLVSDNGTQFVSEETEAFKKKVASSTSVCRCTPREKKTDWLNVSTVSSLMTYAKEI